MRDPAAPRTRRGPLASRSGGGLPGARSRGGGGDAEAGEGAGRARCQQRPHPRHHGGVCVFPAQGHPLCHPLVPLRWGGRRQSVLLPFLCPSPRGTRPQRHVAPRGQEPIWNGEYEPWVLVGTQLVLKGTGGTHGAGEHPAPSPPGLCPAHPTAGALLGITTPLIRQEQTPWVQLPGWRHKQRVKRRLVREGSHPLPWLCSTSPVFDLHPARSSLEVGTALALAVPGVSVSHHRWYQVTTVGRGSW